MADTTHPEVNSDGDEAVPAMVEPNAALEPDSECEEVLESRDAYKVSFVIRALFEFCT